MIFEKYVKNGSSDANTYQTKTVVMGLVLVLI